MIALLLSAIAVAVAHEMPRGCYAVTNVLVVPHGYLIPGLNRFVHDDDALRSGDERFWVCTGGNGQYALYVPPRILDNEGDDL